MRRILSLALIPALASSLLGQVHGQYGVAQYKVKYVGGSVPTLKASQDVSLGLTDNSILIGPAALPSLRITAANVTEVSYGQEAHRRIGTAVGLAFLSFGIGALTAFSKSKQHFIGIAWVDGERRGGVVVQADKKEFRGLLMAIEGLTGKKATNSETTNRVP